jgi:hypothetical protein
MKGTIYLIRLDNNKMRIGFTNNVKRTLREFSGKVIVSQVFLEGATMAHKTALRCRYREFKIEGNDWFEWREEIEEEFKRFTLHDLDSLVLGEKIGREDL